MKKIFKVFVPVLLLAALIILLELGLRLFDYGYNPSFIIRKHTPEGPKAVLNPPALLSYTGLSVVTSSKEAFLNIPVDKPANNIRVVVLGGSAAYGAYHVPDFGMARYMEAMLEIIFPDHHVEVITLAFPSLNSNAMVELLADAMILQPDFVVYYGAANELGRGVAMQVSPLPPKFVIILERIIHSFKQLKLYQLTVNSIGRYFQTVQEGFVKEKIKNFHSFQDFSLPVQKTLAAAYRHNMTKLATLCRSQDIPLVLCEYSHNEKNPCTAAPFANQTTMADILGQLPLLEKAYAHQTDGAYQDAIHSYERFSRILPQFAAPLAHQSFCWYALGHPQQAKARYEQALLRSTGIANQLSLFNSVLWDLAAESPQDDIFFIDTADHLTSESTLGYMADETFFTDIVHFTSRGSYEIAAVVTAFLARAIDPGASEGIPSRQQCEQRLGITLNQKIAVMAANNRRTFHLLTQAMGRAPLNYALMHDVTKKQSLHSLNKGKDTSLGTAASVSAQFSIAESTDYYMWKNQITELVNAGKGEKALSLAKQLNKKTGCHSLALILYGQTLLRNHQPESALEAFRKALKQPERAFDLGLRLSTAELALSLNKFDLAVELLAPGWRIIQNRQPVFDFDKNLFAGFKDRFRATLEEARKLREENPIE